MAKVIKYPDDNLVELAKELLKLPAEVVDKYLKFFINPDKLECYKNGTPQYGIILDETEKICKVHSGCVLFVVKCKEVHADDDATIVFLKEECPVKPLSND
jgi:hypothetical protein